MYVCVCKAVTESHIRDAVAQGCHSMRQLRHELGVVSECGRCAKCARHVLHDALREHGHTTEARQTHFLTFAPEAI